MPHVAKDSDSSEYDPNQEEKEEEDEEVDDAGDDEGEDEEPPPAELVEVVPPPPPPPAAVAIPSLHPLDSIWDSPFIIRKEMSMGRQDGNAPIVASRKRVTTVLGPCTMLRRSEGRG